MCFKAVPELEQKVILGMDFCKLFNVDIKTGEGLWKVKDGEWRTFAESENSESTKIFAECAGISILEVSERERIMQLIEGILSQQSAKSGVTTLTEHHIELTDSVPIRHRLRRLSPKMLEIAIEEVSKLAREGIIERSASDYSSAPVLVKKPDGKIRMCIDYRDLNKTTKRDAYPMPSMDSILDKLRRAKYLSKIDLKAACQQIPMEHKSKKYTAFAIPGSGLWQYTRLPFGLVNAPMTFVRLVDSLFGPEIEPHVFVYLDDIVIAIETFKEHLVWLEFMLKRLADAGLKVNEEKCEFCCSRISYLGFLLDREGLRPDPEKVAPVLNYPPLQNVKQVRSFLGMVGWYARFIARESEHKIPLTKLLHKQQPWQWGDVQQQAFEALKAAITTAPVLAWPDFSKPFVVQCDASNLALGAVLTQEKDDGEHPITYISRVLSPPQRIIAQRKKSA